ncbi:MAG: lipid-binding SYLF domain-containing protein [Alphaproteobacteria bacterium]|nr:lipid-binding SYLF domain-containing protein [Alphaproteobacteria bacterium]
MAIFMVATPAKATELQDAQETIDEALYSIKKILELEKTGPIAEKYLKRARAVFIAPEVLKAALFVGAEGGSGVIMARAANGEWSYPGFFKMGTASFGLQMGAQKTEMLVTIQNLESLNAILEDNVTIGADVSAAVGPVGEGLASNATTNIEADVYSFSVNKGGFIGMSLEGASIWADKEANAAYYGADATVEDIIVNGKHSNPAAEKLRAFLATIPME